MNSRDKTLPGSSKPANTPRDSKKPSAQGYCTNNAQSALGGKTSPQAVNRSLASNKSTSFQERKPNDENKRSKPRGTNQRGLRKSTTIKGKQIDLFNDTTRDAQSSSGSSQEMATTSMSTDDVSSKTLLDAKHHEQETNVDGQRANKVTSQDTDDDESATLLDSQVSSSPIAAKGPNPNDTRTADLTLSNKTQQTSEILPRGWEKHFDQFGVYYWHAATGMIQRNVPTSELKEESLVLYHDDEEINQGSAIIQRNSSEEDDLLESGAALTLADESSATTLQNEILNFIVYPIGCCEFDETQLVSASSSRGIQKCILKLSNNASSEETMCWGLDRSQPILMRLRENYIQFLDLKTRSLYKSQPINTIKAWAVDDDNNFAFVIEERINQTDENEYYDSVEYELLAGPTFMCYVFSSMDDDDMSCRVAAKLNEEINKYKEQMSNRMSKSTRLQQMVEASKLSKPPGADEQTDVDDVDDDLDDLVETNETTMDVKYIGTVQVPRPVGIDVLNVAIDKCLADASKSQMNRSLIAASSSNEPQDIGPASDDSAHSPLIDVKLHVSPSSVIVENTSTGTIIVECRIRYLTFMGISRRDIRWCGFIMQNTANKSFVAHCFECYPTAGHVCDAIQASCSRMYDKMVKSKRHQEDDTTSIIPKGLKIRDTLAKTLSKIKLAPIIQ